MSVGLHHDADLAATVIERFASEQTFLLAAGHQTAAVRTRMIGDHHIMNCLQAAAVGLSLGIDLPTVVRGLEAVEQVPGRLERIECGQPFSVFVDRADTPDRLAVVLKTLRSARRGRVICVFGPSSRTPREERALMGRVVERGADLGVITSNDPGWETQVDVTNDVLDGYQRPARASFIPDRRRAIQWALAQAQAEDLVLVAGKGETNGQDLGDRRLPFDDREEAKSWLYAAASDSSTIKAGSDEPLILRMY
jgi:UDP-N-acetylmuramoyl-L-alanyl-D-glutamate--2,6-diaminopimelate ligase